MVQVEVGIVEGDQVLHALALRRGAGGEPLLRDGGGGLLRGATGAGSVPSEQGRRSQQGDRGLSGWVALAGACPWDAGHGSPPIGWAGRTGGAGLGEGQEVVGELVTAALGEGVG